MCDLKQLSSDVYLTRRELKNIRQELLKQKSDLKSQVENVKALLSGEDDEKNACFKDYNETSYKMTPIGFVSSCFNSKNGIPRQPSLCSAAKATLEINTSVFTNPEHSLIGLNEFSYVWVLFVFHKNDGEFVKAKVHPPRLNGASVGVFSTRSPHRPCALGLSLTKLEKIEGRTLFFSGVDLLDGTPVLDIKPYIPSYDIPNVPREINPSPESETHQKCSSSLDSGDSALISNPHSTSTDHVKSLESFTPSKISKDISHLEYEIEDSYDYKKELSVATLLEKPLEHLDVLFTSRAANDIVQFHPRTEHTEMCDFCLNFVSNHLEAKQAIVEVLQNDPRSVYRRKQCLDKLYYFYIDRLHVTCWFDNNIAEVLRVKPMKSVLTKKGE